MNEEEKSCSKIILGLVGEVGKLRGTLSLIEKENGGKTDFDRVLIAQGLLFSSDFLVSLAITETENLNALRVMEFVPESVQVKLYIREGHGAFSLLQLNRMKNKKNIKVFPHQEGSLWNRSLQYTGRGLAFLNDRFYDEGLIDLTFLVRIFSFQVIIEKKILKRIIGTVIRRYDLNDLVAEASTLQGHVRLLYLSAFKDVLAYRFFWDSSVSPFNFIQPISKVEQKRAKAALMSLFTRKNP